MFKFAAPPMLAPGAVRSDEGALPVPRKALPELLLRAKHTAAARTDEDGDGEQPGDDDDDDDELKKKKKRNRPKGRTAAERWLNGLRASVELPLYFVDVITDLTTTAVLYINGETFWASCMLTIVTASWMSGFAVTLAYAHYRFRFSSVALRVAFVVGLPAGIVLAFYLDLAMLLFAAFSDSLERRAKRLGTSSILHEFATFMSSYTVVRQAVEVTTESLPQAILQLTIYLNLSNDSLRLSTRALVISISVSSVNLLLTWLPIVYNIRFRYANQAYAYFLSQLSGGARIPLEDLEANTSREVAMNFGPSGPSAGEVELLRVLVGRNTETEVFVVSGLPLPVRELLNARKVAVEGQLDQDHAAFIARVLASNVSVETLSLSDEMAAHAQKLELKASVFRLSSAAARRRSSLSAAASEAGWSHDIHVRALLREAHVSLSSEGWTPSRRLLLVSLLLERAAKLRASTSEFDGMRLPLHELLGNRRLELSSDLGFGRRLGRSHAQLLVGLLLRHGGVESVVLDGETVDVRGACEQQSLALASRNLFDAHAVLLAEAISVNPALKSLSLWGNHITDVGMVPLLSTLERSTTLEHLDLSWNPLGEDAIGALAALLVGNESLLSVALNGSRISESGAHRLSRSLAANSTLTTLVLFSNRLGDQGVEHLAAGLRKNQTVTELGLGHNQIGKDGLKALAAAIKAVAEARDESASVAQLNQLAVRIGVSRQAKGILVLSLGGNEIGDEAVAALADVLASDPALRELHLLGNSVGAHGCAALVQALASNTQLRVLDLRDNPIPDEAKAALAKAWKVGVNRNEANLFVS